MFAIIKARYRRLAQLESAGELQLEDQLHQRFAATRRRHADIVWRLADWKQNSSDTALNDVLLFVKAMNPSREPDEKGAPDEPSLDPLWIHLADFDYLDVAADPSLLDQIDAIHRDENLRVVQTLKQRLRAAMRGITEELTSYSPVPETLLRWLERVLAYGSHNVNR